MLQGFSACSRCIGGRRDTSTIAAKTSDVAAIGTSSCVPDSPCVSGGGWQRGLPLSRDSSSHRDRWSECQLHRSAQRSGGIAARGHKHPVRRLSSLDTALQRMDRDFGKIGDGSDISAAPLIHVAADMKSLCGRRPVVRFQPEQWIRARIAEPRLLGIRLLAERRCHSTKRYCVFTLSGF